MPETYWVRQEGRSANGARWWTNVEWQGSVCLGGDAHWLTEQAADEALARLKATQGVED